MIRSPRRPCTDSTPSGDSSPASSVGSQPSWVRGSAPSREQRRSMSPRICISPPTTRRSTPGRAWPCGAAGLGHPVAHTAVGDERGGSGPTDDDATEDRRIEAGEGRSGGGGEGDRSGGVDDRVDVEALVDLEGHVEGHRPHDDRQTGHVGERQAAAPPGGRSSGRPRDRRRWPEPTPAGRRECARPPWARRCCRSCGNDQGIVLDGGGHQGGRTPAPVSTKAAGGERGDARLHRREPWEVGRWGAPRPPFPHPDRVSTKAWPVTLTSSRILGEARARGPAGGFGRPRRSGQATGHERLDRRRPAPHPAAAVVPVLVGTAVAAGMDGDANALKGLIIWRFSGVGRVARPAGRCELRQRLLRRRAGAPTINRVGPMCVASGAKRAGAVKRAAFLSFGVAAVAGLALAVATSWWLILVGLASIAAAGFYRWPPALRLRGGFGELFVFVFFGVVATTGSAFVQIVRVSVPVGMFAVALLVVNNLRDIPGDTVSGKRTLAVRLGDKCTRILLHGADVPPLRHPAVHRRARWSTSRRRCALRRGVREQAGAAGPAAAKGLVRCWGAPDGCSSCSGSPSPPASSSAADRRRPNPLPKLAHHVAHAGGSR